MVRLHVLDDQVIRRRALDVRCDIRQPFVRLVLVHGIHDSDFLVADDVGVVRHAQRHVEVTLEQVDIVVVAADVSDGFCDLLIHNDPSYKNYG